MGTLEGYRRAFFAMPPNAVNTLALLRSILVAFLLVTVSSWSGCKRQPTVYFNSKCAVYTQPNTASVPVGEVFPGRRYEVIDQKGEWYRVEVLSTGHWGWTNCPTKRR